VRCHQGSNSIKKKVDEVKKEKKGKRWCLHKAARNREMLKPPTNEEAGKKDQRGVGLENDSPHGLRHLVALARKCTYKKILLCIKG